MEPITIRYNRCFADFQRLDSPAAALCGTCRPSWRGGPRLVGGGAIRRRCDQAHDRSRACRSRLPSSWRAPIRSCRRRIRMRNCSRWHPSSIGPALSVAEHKHTKPLAPPCISFHPHLSVLIRPTFGDVIGLSIAEIRQDWNELVAYALKQSYLRLSRLPCLFARRVSLASGLTPSARPSSS